MDRASLLPFARPARTPAGSSRARSRPICRSSSQPNSRWSSTSRPPRRSVSPCRKRCLRAPTRSSNERTSASAAVIVSRRVFLSSPIALAAMDNALAATPGSFVYLTYSAGRLSWPTGEARAACGRGGVRADKREGDGASPAGTFALLQAYYRADRIAPPSTHLPIQALRPEDGWVDEPADANYNRLVSLP